MRCKAATSQRRALPCLAASQGGRHCRAQPRVSRGGAAGFPVNFLAFECHPDAVWGQDKPQRNCTACKCQQTQSPTQALPTLLANGLHRCIAAASREGGVRDSVRDCQLGPNSWPAFWFQFLRGKYTSLYHRASVCSSQAPLGNQARCSVVPLSAQKRPSSSTPCDAHQ